MRRKEILAKQTIDDIAQKAFAEKKIYDTASFIQKMIMRTKFIISNKYYILKSSVHFECDPNRFILGFTYETLFGKELCIYYFPLLRVRINF